MKKINDKKLLIACIVLLVACLITAGYFFQQALNAKYATVAEGTGNNQIAKFDVVIDDTSSGYGWANNGKIDPFTPDGQPATVVYTCKVTNNSEVKVLCTPSIEASSLGDYLEVTGSTTATLIPETEDTCTLTVKLKDGYESEDPVTVSKVPVKIEAKQLAE